MLWMFILNRLDHYSTWNRLYQHSYLKQGVSLFLLEPGCTIINTWTRLYHYSYLNQVVSLFILETGCTVSVFLLETGCIIIHTWNRVYHYSYLKQVVSLFLHETCWTIILTWDRLEHSFLNWFWAASIALVIHFYSNVVLFTVLFIWRDLNFSIETYKLSLQTADFKR